MDLTHDTITEHFPLTTSIHNLDFSQLSLDEPTFVSVTASQRDEIERRIVEADAGRMPGYPWEEVRQRLLDRKQ